MSRALAVFHGRFGRATVYQLNRPFNIHAHREGHLIFHVGGMPACIDVSAGHYDLNETSVVAVNPWEPHNFLPTDLDGGAIFFVLYVNPEWFAPDASGTDRLRFGRTQFKRTVALDKHIRRTAALVCGAPSLSSLDSELRRLIDICYDESWQQAETVRDARASGAVTDFRVRKCIKLMSESPGAEMELDTIARESGLSRPHFYRLFRVQTGVTPNLYLNTLIMEQALEALVASEAPIADIGFDLGFSSQSGFTRFFAANVGMAPTDYRRAAKVLRA
ncbi:MULTISPECIES: helix-turn-helix domain-containing protein [Bradyrhizobium]|jgi:AraC-like DNA-binding protein|uniref:Transcriptional regulatory protein n=2 Tax=Bradyrhizobium diazoefficiens TaxID=1355477 RepID=Q89PU4_BRADU|nr:MULTISPECIES: AraC family transcriptional regulator [Bradyrhizobium]MBP1066665.1 AraC-like DNA-binding protein [Bradyrhizobium japonicum]AND88793.1 AraC family transcriptional regulator [Bradyrhizobium diazoefficiens USDA 110]APO54565.1 AraC family transcriptional regulator [Bradyrhizobium diazoefficiens]AWO90364.1 helix-turn-helix transcriptional regulator [Bradyrhizobium diazoefficiens]KGJ68928.1 putative transcriptional regulatory protein [Bradyrhizobium diazoefficiens SEMIA 5080]